MSKAYKQLSGPVNLIAPVYQFSSIADGIRVATVHCTRCGEELERRSKGVYVCPFGHGFYNVQGRHPHAIMRTKDGRSYRINLKKAIHANVD